MAFKGKSTIELRNAKTGEVEQLVKDENMVTNAVANFANPPDSIVREFGTYSAGFPEMADLMTPLTTQALQGIILFDKNITEDPNIIIPNASQLNQVGCASDATNSNANYRGVLNIAETKSLENGYLYVWDFATDKANGTIKSVALSSPAGAYFGSDVGSSDPSNEPISCRFRGLRSGITSKAILTSMTVSFDWKIGSYGAQLCAGVDKFNYPIGSFEKDTYLFLQPPSGGPTSYIFHKCKINNSKLCLKDRRTEERTQITVMTNGARLSMCP
ncbi:MAG: hypothetical protein RR564_05025, partial [Eubacterium sp.]